jgi:hypothetical protein
MGLVSGYLMASWVPHESLRLVFLIVLVTFIAYGIFMLIAMRAISEHEKQYLALHTTLAQQERQASTRQTNSASQDIAETGQKQPNCPSFSICPTRCSGVLPYSR